MSLTTSYLQTTKNMESIINSLVGAKAPERFTNKFLEDLGFKSSNDRLYIGLFKSLGLLDESSSPTSRYHRLLDQAETGHVLAEGIQEAYEDLFALKKDAQNLSVEEVKGKLKTLTQGQKSDKIINLMANTFKSLCDIADWDDPIIVNAVNKDDKLQINNQGDRINEENVFERLGLHYNIQIHLPETTNMEVYDAIFQSLKNHLL